MRGAGAMLAPLVFLCGCARRYPVEGLVLRADPAARTLLVSHREVKGYMPAMAMSFPVARGEELRGLRPGSRVTFELRVAKPASVARKIRAVPPDLTGVADADEPLRLPAPPNKLAIGEAVPDFALTDQQGRAFRFSELRGQVVVVDFIYSRCPLPEVCPRLSASFAALQRRIPGVALVSVTIDPSYDTPEVLAGYARRYGANPERWRFLTGPDPEIQRVAGMFGLVYWPEEGLITHTSSTAVVGRDGRLKALIEGLGFTADQLRDLVANELASGGR
jgi:protein SCO1/2